MKAEQPEDVLKFWFQSQPGSDVAAMVHQWDWWFREVVMRI